MVWYRSVSYQTAITLFKISLLKTASLSPIQHLQTRFQSSNHATITDFLETFFASQKPRDFTVRWIPREKNVLFLRILKENFENSRFFCGGGYTKSRYILPSCIVNHFPPKIVVTLSLKYEHHKEHAETAFPCGHVRSWPYPLKLSLKQLHCSHNFDLNSTLSFYIRNSYFGPSLRPLCSKFLNFYYIRGLIWASSFL